MTGEPWKGSRSHSFAAIGWLAPPGVLRCIGRLAATPCALDSVCADPPTDNRDQHAYGCPRKALHAEDTQEPVDRNERHGGKHAVDQYPKDQAPEPSFELPTSSHPRMLPDNARR